MAAHVQEAEPLRVATPLTRRLMRSVSLSSQEASLLDELQVPSRTIPRNREIITEGRKYGELFVLLEGVAIRYRVLHDGRRQILNIALPGDLIGFPACFFETALYSVTALTEAQVSSVPVPKLLALFERQGRLAAILIWLFSCEAAMHVEHLIDLGRRSAVERVAHFLLELLTRLQAVGLADERSYTMPLTQELMGDTLGLSVPHVNRTLRQLRDDGLVAIDGHRVAIKDYDALAALADFEKSALSRLRISEALAQD
jgi:CRP-like cAMP-binding protein